MAKSKPKRKASAKAQTKSKRSAPATSGKEDGNVLLSWTVRPYRQEKGKLAIVIISTLAFCGLVWYAFDLFSAIFALLVCFGAFSSFLLPTDYRITEEGIRTKNGFNSAVYYRWSAFSSYHFYPDGVQLMYQQRHLRERIRKGQFIYFGEADAERIKEIIAERVGRAED